MKPLFDSDFLKKLEYLSLMSKRIFRGQIFAKRRTAAHGGGVEFADYRNYFPGDDLRCLDWNVYARFNVLLLKRFEEEEDLPVYIMIDSSKSMIVGDPVKFDYARILAAALAYIALADSDRVSLMTFDDRVQEELPLTRGKENILALLRFLENCSPADRETDFEFAMKQFALRNQRRGLVIILSDFYDPNGWRKGVDLLRFGRYDPVLIQIHDPSEAEPDFKGDYRLKDAESSFDMDVTVSENVLLRYKMRYKEFLDELVRYSMQYSIGCAIAATSVPFDELILQMLRESSFFRQPS